MSDSERLYPREAVDNGQGGRGCGTPSAEVPMLEVEAVPQMRELAELARDISAGRPTAACPSRRPRRLIATTYRDDLTAAFTTMPTGKIPVKALRTVFFFWAS